MKTKDETVVLIVEDEAWMRKAITSDFKKKGYQVLEAADGNEALQVIAAQRIDVVVSDVRMPVLDGIELLQEIKKMHVYVPIVFFMTGFAGMTIEDAFAWGADAIFPKPYDRAEMFRAVEDAMKTRDERWRATADRNECALSTRYESVAAAIENKLLSFGRWGFFVATKNLPPKIDSKMYFDLKFDEGSLKNLTGHGILRWARYYDSTSMLPGWGIEIVDLEPSCRDAVISFFEKISVASFIPIT